MKTTKNDEAKMDNAIDAMLSLWDRLNKLDVALSNLRNENNHTNPKNAPSCGDKELKE
nr:MAG TPA: hypothetical protein [Caudoviricetes sp.]